MNTVFCQKLKKQAEALARAPLPGPLGQKILAEISKEAWQLWLIEQTKIINELRLKLSDPQTRATLGQHMQEFLFGPPA